MKTPNKKTPDKNAQADTALDKARELAANGQLNAAIAALAAVEKRHRKNPRLQGQLARYYLQAGHAEPAARHGDWALAVAGDKPPVDLLEVRVEAELRLGRPAPAEKLALRGLQIHRNRAALYHLLSSTLGAQNKLVPACRAAECAVNLHPHQSAFQLKLANSLEAIDQNERALRVYKNVIQSPERPANAPLQYGNLLQRLGHNEAARQAYQLALEAMGHKGFIYLNLGALNRRVGDIDAAYECYRKSAILSPGDGGVYYNLGNLERGRLDCTAATRWFRRAIAIRPDDGTFHWNLALVLLLDDQLSQGFAEYEWRWQHSGFPSRRRTFEQPEWDGAPFDGKTLLIHAEQGMGDHFQFLRFIGDIAKRKGETGKIILECHGPLMPLLADFPEADQVIEREVETNDHLPPFDIHMPIVSAPHRLGVRTWDDMPQQHPYLQVPAGSDVELPGLRPEALKIGFVWGGNPDFSDDRARSTKIDFFQPLFDLPGTQFFCLQKGPREPEIAAAPAHVVRANERIETFRDTAAIMEKMDIVITTCTSVAHLAGGLGRPTWVLLHHTSDWRWLQHREDSPWYPSARLFRQPTPGDWDSVFTALGAALSEAAAAHTKG